MKYLSMLFRNFASHRLFVTVFLFSGVLLLFSCSRDPSTQTASTADGTTNGADSGIGDHDYNYDRSGGRFNEDGVWEQYPEFCYPPRFPEVQRCEGEEGLWARALQMALWFFNVNKSGDGVYCTDVQWRGNAHTGDARIRLEPGNPNGVDMSSTYIEQYRHVFDPGHLGTVDLSGGYYDAGDFIKFAMTQGFMASTIAWAMVEFPDAFSRTGLFPEAFDQIRWAADYFMKATFVEDTSLPAEQWNVIGYAHQVGDGSDHTCGWMPPELRTPEKCPRKAYFATHERPAADVTAASAAALALTAIVAGESDPDYAQRCLNHAIALYRFAAQYPTALATAAGGLYVSEYAFDDLGWAAGWLYRATGDPAYLDEAVDWMHMFPGFISRDVVETMIQWNSFTEDNAGWVESWTHVWNSVRSGMFVTLAGFMKEARHPYQDMLRLIARKDTMSWVDGPHSPQGFAHKVDVSWGSGRYNSAGQLVALAYARRFPEDPDRQRIIDWAKRQSRYLLGDNQVNGDPLGKSFMMGFTDLSPNTPTEPHHAAGHASIYGQPDTPQENRHIIWGALVNGPRSDDTHEDERADFGSNEVTIDYNASWVGALAGNTFFQSAYEGNWCPDPRFPGIEPPIDEFYTMAKINTEGTCRSQVEITMMNESIHPPRFNEHLTARYYIDITELAAAGIAPETMTATIVYDNGATEFGEPTAIRGPFPCENDEIEEARNTWYFVLSYEGYQFWGRQVRLTGPRTTLVDFGVPDGGTCVWDPSNDWSYDALTTEEQKTPHITAYGEDGKLLWGEEPPCHPIQHVIIPPPPID